MTAESAFDHAAAKRMAEYIQRQQTKPRLNESPDLVLDAERHKSARDEKTHREKVFYDSEVAAPMSKTEMTRTPGEKHSAVHASRNHVRSGIIVPPDSRSPLMRPQTAATASKSYPLRLINTAQLVNYLHRVASSDIDEGWLYRRYGKSLVAELWDVPLNQLVLGNSHKTVHKNERDAMLPYVLTDPMPPILVEPFHGKYLVIDGNRRTQRARAAHLDSLPAYVVKV